jgi:hypothetical protein
MQRKQRFVADQRYDLPHHESMMDYISKEFYSYNKAFFSPLSRIVSNWRVENNGGLSIRVNNTSSSLLFISEKINKEGINFREEAYTLLTHTLADNSINFVEIQIVSDTCAPDTVAIWDTTANSGAGEEYTQTVDTAYEEEPLLISNTIAFTGDSDKLPLAIVTTSGGVIVSIVDARKMLFELESDWNFGVTRTDRTIGSLKNAYDALATSIKEIKGVSKWYDAPFASTKILKEYQNMFISGGGLIRWAVSGPNILEWTSNFDIEIANRSSTYTINAASLNVPEGSAVYVDIPTNTPLGPVTPVVAPLSDVPLSSGSSGFSPNIQVLFFRRNNKIISTTLDLPDLTAGESSSVGEDLPQGIRTRLGITTDVSFEAYTSISVIGISDSYPTALSKLDNQILTMLNSHPDEEEWIVTDPSGQSVFVASSLLWNPSNSIEDIVVTVNGQKLKIDNSGGFNKDFRKDSSNQLAFAYTIPYGASLVVWKSVANGGSLGGSALSIQEESTPVEGAVSTINFVGSGVTATSVSPGVVRVEVNTASAVSLRKLVKNMSGALIPAFSCLTWTSMGTVELADANIASKTLFAGINEADIPDGAYGFAIKEGNVAGALATLGASPGDIVYMGEEPGELTLTAPLGITDAIFKIGRAEPPDGLAQPQAIDLYLEPEIISSP